VGGAADLKIKAAWAASGTNAKGSGRSMTNKPPAGLTLTPNEIQAMVRVVRGQRVLLDFDLAQLYGVTTSTLNQAVQRHADRFPDDFAYQLTRQEFAALISQTVISKPGRGGRRKLPWVFTEWFPLLEGIAGL